MFVIGIGYIIGIFGIGIWNIKLVCSFFKIILIEIILVIECMIM